jgi:predicted AAA+ superfamily ATPase
VPTPRPYFLNKIQQLAKSHPIVALLGPRQCGKTTLARMYASHLPQPTLCHTFDLENPRDLARLAQPLLALEGLEGLTIIDEIQRYPDLFPVLRYLMDRTNNLLQLLILGSASRELMRQSSESLAGRIAYLELTPFIYGEVDNIEKLWLRGGFPRAYLAHDQQECQDWREFYITNFLERDLPNLGIHIPPVTMRRFWTMLCHYHGNVLNSSELARAMGISDKIIREYLDILQGTFMIRLLQPWHENLKKRQVKSPKIYVRDSGLLHTLLGIDEVTLFGHPKVGASWEGFALEQIIHYQNARPQECFFWATHAGAELDLLICQHGKKIGFEFKRQDAPSLSKSMQIACEDLQLEKLFVICPGNIQYMLTDKIMVIGIEKYASFPNS